MCVAALKALVKNICALSYENYRKRLCYVGMDRNVWGVERDNSRHTTIVRAITLKNEMVGRLQLFKKEIKFLSEGMFVTRMHRCL